MKAHEPQGIIQGGQLIDLLIRLSYSAVTNKE